MIYLNPGNNSITLTLGDMSILTQSYYTFGLTRKGSFETVYFTADDNSTAPYYWNRFTVSVGTVSGLTNGQIDINAGEWTYNAYEMSNPYDLNIDNAVKFLQTGICIVSRTYSTIQSYTGSNSSTIVYYQNK